MSKMEPLRMGPGVPQREADRDKEMRDEETP